ncbi:MAG: 16S rRNA (cytosine(1402)-N(4))-methyltransferase RsmH [Halarsenatibacteraceae bacterium]
MMTEHNPVLLEKTIKYLNIKPDGIYFDGTLGRGGHSKAIIDKLSKEEGFLIGIDKDLKAIEYCQKYLPEEKIKLFHESFTAIPEILSSLGISGLDGIVLDLGVSSPQLDKAERGFSYSQEAPLDMRMDKTQSLTAKKIVNNYSVDKLNDIIYKYGEERWASRIAEFIVRERKKSPIKTTQDLVDVIKMAIPASARSSGGHPARRTFQAIRIETNQELNELEKILELIPSVLNKGGRACIISFHSLEDRLVKHSFRDAAKECICPPEIPVCRCDKEKTLKVITRSLVRADEKEIEENRRARSAKLRVAERI